FKHSSGWRYTMDPDGTLHVTTPEGHHISTHPSGPLATHRRDRARTEHARWHTQTHWEHHHLRPTRTPPAEPTFWHRRAQRPSTHPPPRHTRTPPQPARPRPPRTPHAPPASWHRRTHRPPTPPRADTPHRTPPQPPPPPPAPAPPPPPPGPGPEHTPRPLSAD